MSESADNYGRVVARLNARWRVVECLHCLQWVLQRIAGAETGATSRGSTGASVGPGMPFSAVAESMLAPSTLRRRQS